MNPKKFRGLCQTGCGNAIKKGATKYCSIRCMQQAHPKKPRGSCLNRCGASLNQNADQYCSFYCMHAHRYACRARTFILQGGINGHVPGQFLARVLRDIYGERCARCGWAQRHVKTGKVPVEVEHVDGNWENNRLDNLTLLCPNCHALTPTFRALNWGRGRAHRLGGRGNPLRDHAPSEGKIVRVRKVFEPELMQLPLLLPT
jgi:hypothetical protein